MKKKLLFLFAMTLFLSGNLFAQIDINAGTYSFQRNGFAPTTMSNPITLIGASSDNVASAVIDLGFTFWFAGTPYTQFSVSENGLMTLGSTRISGTDVNNNMASATTNPKIAPYWDDLATGSNGWVKYEITGTTSKLLTVQWYVTVPKNTTGAANALIQVQLTEYNGYVTFTYGYPAVPVNGSLTIGIGKASNDFASVTPTSATAATVAYGTSNNSVSVSPGVYTRYNFIPDATAPTINAYPLIASTFGTQNRTVLRTISDTKAGIPTSGSYVPRVYYKRSTETSYVSTAGVQQSGTSANGSWLFTLDHSLLPGGAANEGDQIDYFILAQDQSTTFGSPNIQSSPAGAVASDVNNLISAPATPSYYIIGSSFSGTKTVGTGGDFESLSLPGGLFEQLNAGQLTGNLTINIISDLVETGIVALNKWVSDAGGPYTITINPSGARTSTSLLTE